MDPCNFLAPCALRERVIYNRTLPREEGHNGISLDVQFRALITFGRLSMIQSSPSTQKLVLVDGLASNTEFHRNSVRVWNELENVSAVLLVVKMTRYRTYCSTPNTPHAMIFDVHFGAASLEPPNDYLLLQSWQRGHDQNMPWHGRSSVA